MSSVYDPIVNKLHGHLQGLYRKSYSYMQEYSLVTTFQTTSPNFMHYEKGNHLKSYYTSASSLIPAKELGSI